MRLSRKQMPHIDNKSLLVGIYAYVLCQRKRNIPFGHVLHPMFLLRMNMTFFHGNAVAKNTPSINVFSSSSCSSSANVSVPSYFRPLFYDPPLLRSTTVAFVTISDPRYEFISAPSNRFGSLVILLHPFSDFHLLFLPHHQCIRYLWHPPPLSPDKYGIPSANRPSSTCLITFLVHPSASHAADGCSSSSSFPASYEV